MKSLCHLRFRPLMIAMTKAWKKTKPLLIHCCLLREFILRFWVYFGNLSRGGLIAFHVSHGDAGGNGGVHRSPAVAASFLCWTGLMCVDEAVHRCGVQHGFERCLGAFRVNNIFSVDTCSTAGFFKGPWKMEFSIAMSSDWAFNYILHWVIVLVFSFGLHVICGWGGRRKGSDCFVGDQMYASLCGLWWQQSWHWMCILQWLMEEKGLWCVLLAGLVMWWCCCCCYCDCYSLLFIRVCWNSESCQPNTSLSCANCFRMPHNVSEAKVHACWNLLWSQFWKVSCSFERFPAVIQLVWGQRSLFSLLGSQQCWPNCVTLMFLHYFSSDLIRTWQWTVVLLLHRGLLCFRPVPLEKGCLHVGLALLSAMHACIMCGGWLVGFAWCPWFSKLQLSSDNLLVGISQLRETIWLRVRLF